MPNNPYNCAIADILDFVNNALDAAHDGIEDCIDNNGSDRRFDRLTGRVAALSGLYLELKRLERPEHPAQSE